MSITYELVNLLVCPVCHQKLVLSEDKTSILCEMCRMTYRVDDDIPIMMVDEAEKLTNS